MPLIKHGTLVEDIWHETDDFADVQTLAPLGPVIVTLNVWRQHRAAILAYDGRLGLRLAPGQTPDLVAADLHHFELVELEFAKFTDGRAYSHARLLRERHGFKGELRAVGEVLRDQLSFMLRCGFDAFSLETDQQAEALLAAVDEFAYWYQPAPGTSGRLDHRSTIPALRQGAGNSTNRDTAGCAATWAY